MDALRLRPAADDVDRSLSARRPSLELAVDRARAADLGVPAAQVATTVRALVNGERAGLYRAGDADVDVLVRLRADDRRTADDLQRLPVVTARGVLAPLSAVTRAVPSTEPPTIDRANRQRQIVVGVGYLGRAQSAVVADARVAVAGVPLPPGVAVRVIGQEQYTDEAFASLGVALALAVLFVYMILASQFASYVHPFTIMLALPFSAAGALLTLFAFGRGLDILAMIGLILLMGLVTKNSILLVEFANQLRRRGLATRAALLEAGPIRLRPILMTTLAMIFGMVPVALGLGAGGDLRQSMGIAVVGGLVVSTLLTLVAVPVAYSLIEDAISLVRPRREAAGPPAGPSASEPAEPVLNR
jgi:HAE1 family hydrophobic/amphiphilic exporter-1